MKCLGIGLVVILLAASCRKSTSGPGAGATAPAAKENESTPIRLEGPATPDPAETAGTENSRTRSLPKPPDKEYAKPAIPTAVAVEGRPGFVTSPFNDKVIDVRDIPPGTMVADPTYPSEERKIFRVP